MRIPHAALLTSVLVASVAGGDAGNGRARAQSGWNDEKATTAAAADATGDHDLPGRRIGRKWEQFQEEKLTRETLGRSANGKELREECYSPTTDPSSPSYYRGIYDFLRSQDFDPSYSERIGSVEVVKAGSLTFRPTDGDNDNDNDNDIGDNLLGMNIAHPPTEILLLPLFYINAFSFSKLDEGGTLTLDPRGNQGIGAYGDIAGSLLGIHHFNNGDGSVVPEIKDIQQRCPIRFVVPDVFDSEASQLTALDIFSQKLLEDPARPPAVLVGAWRSAVSIPLATLSGVYAIPQISPASTSAELDDVTQYTHFGRLVPSDAGTARALIDYFRQRAPDLRHLGTLFVNDQYGASLQQNVVESAALLPDSQRITVRGSPFNYNNAILNPNEIDLAVKHLADSGYRTFFGIFYDEHYDLVMNAAIKYGIAGPNYRWIISDGLAPSYLNNRPYKAGSPLAIASQGIGILKAEGGRETVEGNSGYDRFVRAWYDQDDDMVDYYNCVGHPETNTIKNTSIYYQAEPGFFTERRLPPTSGAAFGYDSVISLGLAACGLLEDEGRASDAHFGGTELFQAFVKQTFEGASGDVLVDPDTTSRDPKSAFFVLYNADGMTEDGVTMFKVDTVSHTKMVSDATSSVINWVDMEGKAFVYSDGTTVMPNSLPPVQHNMNHLSTAVRASGLTLAAVIFASAVFFSSWVFRQRKSRVVRASQPMFLQKISVGAIFMGATIITLSIDDSVASERGCNLACMLNPWLFAYGFVIAFSALFSKTWRINKIFHNPSCKRVKVTARDVILPFVILFALNTIVLAVWTAVSPLQWERIEREGEDKFERNIESYGVCINSTKDWVPSAPYIATLIVLNFAMLVLANVQAYRARKIATEYSESKFIGIIMASILQACVIGLPLIILSSSDPAAFFIVRAGIIFVICMSMLLLMFIPKMRYLKKWKIEKQQKELEKKEREWKRKQAMARAVTMGYTKSTAGRAAGGSDTSQTALTGNTISLSKERRISELGEESYSSFGVEKTNEVGPDEGTVQFSDSPGGLNATGPTQNKMAPKNVLHLETDGHLDVVEESNGKNGSNLDADEELGGKDGGMLDAVEESAIRNLDVDKESAIIAFATEDSTLAQSFSSNDTGDDGYMRIISHPEAESKKVRLLRDQLDHMKQEKLAMYSRNRQLLSILKKNGIVVNDEEFELLTVTNEDANLSRTRNQRNVDGDANLTASVLAHRDLDHARPEASDANGGFKRQFKKFQSARLSPGALKLGGMKAFVSSKQGWL